MKSIEEFQNELATPKTREGLIRLYVQIVSSKPDYRFDPKRMILDVLPGKADLFKVSMVNHAYSLGKSREDYPKLDIKEHRFINFLKFASFTQQEIDRVFDAYESTQPSLEHPKNSTPSSWEYTTAELYHFLRSATQEPFELPLDAAEGVPLITPSELERLYGKDVKRTKRLRKDLEGIGSFAIAV